MLEGLMQNDFQLTIPAIARRLDDLYGDGEVITLHEDGPQHTTYAEVSARRPGRPLRLEQPAPPRALLRGAERRRGPPHGQRPPLPRADHLRDQPRKRRRRLRRRLARAPDRAARRRHRRGPPLGGHGRWRRVGTSRRALLRGAHRRSSRRHLRLARDRRAPGRVPLLHERHHRQPEGGPLLPPGDRAALDGELHDRRAGDLGTRPCPDDRADVPRQRLASPTARR